MEVGLGIASQDSPPLYLMDGEHRIKISDSINDGDATSKCERKSRPTRASSRSIRF